MKITVIICTYQRCHSLARALESLAVSVLPAGVDWEVLVVDNNSRDQTRQVVEEASQRYAGRFRYLLEPQPGKSNALNAGIREARGEILAFTDDDVIVEQNWLQNLTAPFRDANCAGVGGKILPQWNCPPPAWLSLKERYALSPLSVFDPGIEAGPLTESPFGANMAFRRGIFEKYGGFRTDLGPGASGTNPQKSEDNEFSRRLLAAGENLRYEPTAVVYHPVSQQRLQQKYFLAWWFEKVRADIQAFGVPHGSKRFICGVPGYLFRRLVLWALRWQFAVKPSARFSCKRRVWLLAAQILETYRQSRRSGTIAGNEGGQVASRGSFGIGDRPH